MAYGYDTMDGAQAALGRLVAQDKKENPEAVVRYEIRSYGKTGDPAIMRLCQCQQSKQWVEEGFVWHPFLNS